MLYAHNALSMDFIPLILACAPFVSPDTMTTYIEQRSQADPLAIHITETDRWIRPKDQAEAIAAAKKLVEDGMAIEAGLAQINSTEWQAHGLTAKTVFNPCRNLSAAEGKLVDQYRKTQAQPAPTKPRKRQVVNLVSKLAPQYSLDPNLVLALIEAESSFNPKARSPKNAQGLMQLIPATAKRFGVANPWDPEQNLRGGMAYLRWLLDHFNGDVKLALAGYNAGEKAVERHGGIPPYRETRAYVKRIVKRLGTSGQQPAAAIETAAKGKAEEKSKQADLAFEVVVDGFSDGDRLRF